VTFDFVEAVKFIGGLSGLASGSFLIYDRLVRFRPTIFLRPSNNNVYLVIKNTMPETLVIDQITVAPAYLEIVVGEDLPSTLKIVHEKARQPTNQASQVFVVVDPLSEKLCQLLQLKGFDDLPRGTRFKIRCQWRNTRRPFFLKRNVSVSTTMMDMLRLQSASHTRAFGGHLILPLGRDPN
jgi:hypothetical protein